MTTTMMHNGTNSVRSGVRLRPILTYVVLLTLAIVAVIVFSRGKTTSASAAPAGHNHAAAAATSAARPVMLTSDDARRIGVTYTVAVISPLETEVRTVAQVTVDERRVRTIAPKLDGWVEQLFVNVTGQPVRRGDPLLAIYSPMLVSAQQELLLASQLRSDMSKAQPDARDGSAGLEEAARKRLRYWDIAESDIERIERTGEVQKSIVLRSPVSGIVLEKAVSSGQKIMAGEALFEVADLSVVWIEGEVFERDLAAVRIGQVAIADFQALPGVHRSGRITYIYPTINPETRTARLRLELANSDLALKPGMYATIRVQGSTANHVLNIPRSAVLTTGERSLVFVRRADGMLEPREVTPGLTNDDRVEILSGLAVGETVVKSATFLVDAESNLGSALGGMGDMPGMDIAPPSRRGTP